MEEEEVCRHIVLKMIFGGYLITVSRRCRKLETTALFAPFSACQFQFTTLAGSAEW